jgi:hypothetical protein
MRLRVRLITHGISLALLNVAVAGSTVAGAVDSTDVASPEFVAALQKLLDLGVDPDVENVAKAEQAYSAASELHPHDPRLEYAYALVLHRMFQSTEAEEHLRQAGNQKPGYFPAQQALTRDLLRRRQYAETAEYLSSLIAETSPDSAEAAEQAQWIGRIVACVAGPVGSKDARERFRYLDASLRRTMPAILEASYDRGFHDLQQEVEELQGVIDDLESEAAEKESVATISIDAATANRREELKLQAEDAQKTAKQWDDWVADETRKVDVTLSEMEKKYGDLERSITAQTAMVAAMRLMLNGGAFPTNLNQTNFGQTSLFAFNQIPVTPNIDQALLFSEQKLSLLYAAQADLSTRATAELNQRKAIVAQYQKATGQVMREAESLAKWKGRIERSAKRAKEDAAKKPGQVASLESRMKNINTYDPTDFEIERNRILSEFAPPAESAEK